MRRSVVFLPGNEVDGHVTFQTAAHSEREMVGVCVHVHNHV
jgi:hypothetical protein